MKVYTYLYVGHLLADDLSTLERRRQVQMHNNHNMKHFVLGNIMLWDNIIIIRIYSLFIYVNFYYEMLMLCNTDSLKINALRNDSLVPTHYDRGNSGSGGESSDYFDGNLSWQPCKFPRWRVSAWRRQRHTVVSKRVHNNIIILYNILL